MVTSTQQFNLLVEYFRTANQRLSFRIRQRDLWLKTQLLLQIILILIVSIGKLQFPGKEHAFHDLLILSFPMAALCCSLYSTQDRLISHIIAYLNDLAETATNYGNQMVPFKNLEVLYRWKRLRQYRFTDTFDRSIIFLLDHSAMDRGLPHLFPG